MNWIEARTKALLGFPIRREGWRNKWFILWRGVWWCMGSDYRHVVEATDYGPDEFLATDWTIIPAALDKCPPPNSGIGDGDKDDPGEDTTPLPSPLPPPPPPGPAPGPSPGPGPGPGPTPPSPPSPATCSFGSLTIALTPYCDSKMIYAELNASGMSEGTYSVIFFGPMSTVSGGMIIGTGGIQNAQMTIGDDFRCRSITISARVTAFSGPCRGRQSSASASIQWCCDDEPCTPDVGCCPGEDGYNCGHLTNGDPCCCCDAHYAPNGPNCECVYVG
jgi:hypothetical protein